jgi:hypothetical protein
VSCATAYFIFWLKKMENEITTAQIANNQASPMIAIMFTSLGRRRARFAKPPADSEIRL